MADQTTFDPLFARGRETSEAAAKSIRKCSSDLRGRVLDEIRRSGGATCDQVEAKLDLRHQTASARVYELHKLGLIVDSGIRALTRSRRKAVVWCVAARQAAAS